ncbi:MAG: GTPase HflX, partial [Firmicutes bacterium]|nr:GTPase HflX [Bacillota bacterium]
MQELFENKVKPPKMLIVGVETDGFFDFEQSLKEIKELCKNLGGEIAGVITQKRQSLQPATCIGEGKIAEVLEFCKNSDIDVIAFDLELSPAQLKNLSKAIPDFDIIDRTMLILDIFAMRANTAEGKIQVELAKMKYALPRLKGSYTSLSRIGGGIGTRRGLGESKLELDRRHISERIDALKEEIKELQNRRKDLRLRRKKDDVLCVALAGYTNSGKSTLLNALTKSDAFVEDKLFATLDPTSRALKLPDNQEV